MKVLGVILDMHIFWLYYVRIVENKIAKNTNLIYTVSQFFNKEFLKTVYFSYIHSSLNYTKIAWRVRIQQN